jgi:outer membrane lipoprotein carrier protein
VTEWRRLAASCLLAGLLASSAHGGIPGEPAAAAGQPAQLAGRLAERLVPVARFSAEFVQTVRGSRDEVREMAEGYVRIERPRRFKWVVEDPYPQLIVTGGERLYIYDPDLDQVQVRTVDEALHGTPALVLAGTAEQIDDEFEVSERADGETTVFTLVPRDPEALYTALTMTFSPNELVGIDIVDSLGQVTEVRFYNGEPDPTFPPNEFDFTIPPNADVIGDDDAGPA